MNTVPKPAPKRCTFELSPELHETIAQIAEDNYTTSTEIVRKFLKLGIMAIDADTTVLLQKGGDEKRVIVLI